MLNWGLFFAYVASSAFTPGPNNITSMAQAKAHGLLQSLWYAIGVLGGFSTLVFICCMFNSFIVTFLPWVKYVFAALGTLYFIYLAYKTLFSKQGADAQGSTPKVGVVQSTLIQFINPHGIVYALAVSATFITPYYHTLVAYALFALCLGITALIAAMLWALFGMAIHRFFKKYNLYVNIFMAALLLYCAYTIFMGMFV